MSAITAYPQHRECPVVGHSSDDKTLHLCHSCVGLWRRDAYREQKNGVQPAAQTAGKIYMGVPQTG